MPEDNDLSLAKLQQLAGIDIYNKGAPEFKVDTRSVFEKKQYEHAHCITPGTPEWFDLWFCSSNSTNMFSGFRGRRK